MKKAVKFIDENYKDIDLLFLHNLRVDVDNEINTKIFTNGFGATTHSYFITRHYIQSIIKKYGKLPEPNGIHFDFELNQNKFSKDNWIYSEKMFFTNKECIKQLDQNKCKSDNYLNIIDKLFRQDINEQIKIFKLLYLFLRKHHNYSDNQLKILGFFINYIVT
jgi:hypothetical protein